MKTEVINISSWQELNYLNSGGTRNKKIVSNQEGDLYYFKESYDNGRGKFYRYEFYSEVIASFLGKMIGLSVLQYDIAIFKTQIGCLSKSMITEQEELIEGGKYLKAYDNTFIVENENPKAKYTFQLIVNALDSFKITQHGVDELVDIIIFDAIIGNSDRHQENWGFIAQSTKISQAYSEIEKSLEGKETNFPKIVEKLLDFIKRQPPSIKNEIIKKKLELKRELRFAPIYDSGCCLGRELSKEKILKMLANESEILSYINKGLAEIHWDGQKLNHLVLLKRLVEQDEKIRQRVVELCNQIHFDKLQEFINVIDNEVPDDFADWRIPKERKTFIVKLLTLRVHNLLNSLNE